MPAAQLDEVIRTLFANAESMGWENLSSARRTAQYDRWVSSPQVGGILTAYMTAENARSWIKDGPMKEYGKARIGAGRYSRFGRQEGVTHDETIIRALGAGYVLIPGTSGDKPFHCEATNGKDVAYVTWGQSKNLRHLVWAGIARVVKEPPVRVAIVIMESVLRPTKKTDIEQQDKIAARCGFGIVRMAEDPRRETLFEKSTNLGSTR